MVMQVEHKTEKRTLCFQKVKDNHTHFELAKLADYDPDDYLYLIADESFTKLPPGKWKLIGLTSEVTELQAMNMLDYQSDNDEHQTPIFKDYTSGQYGLSPLDSFKSLMQHLKINDSEKWVVLFKEN